MKHRLLIVALVGFGTALAADFSIGINVGPPPPPRVLAVRPPTPGPEFVWVNGYWYPVNGRYVWHEGYWSRPPYPGAVWVGPRHEGGRYFTGFWQGEHGRVEHEHRWDRDRDRDYNRSRDRDRDRDRDRHEDHDRH